MMRLLPYMPAFAAGLLLVCATASAGPLKNTFDHDSEGWMVEFQPAPWVPGGGPGGAGDAHLRIPPVPWFGRGDRIVFYPLYGWYVDYTTTTGVRLDVQNLGPDDVHLQMAFGYDGETRQGFGRIATAYTQEILVRAGGGWSSIVFSTLPRDMTGDYIELALANVNTIDIFSSEWPVNSVIGVDNIEALFIPTPSGTVPEPASWSLVGAGLLFVWRWVAAQAAIQPPEEDAQKDNH